MDKEERRKAYEKFISEWGESLQIVVAIEEMSELTKELSKTLRGKIDTLAVIEELVDVKVMIEQLEKVFDFDLEEIEKRMNKKVVRTVERMEKHECKADMQ